MSAKVGAAAVLLFASPVSLSSISKCSSVPASSIETFLKCASMNGWFKVTQVVHINTLSETSGY